MRRFLSALLTAVCALACGGGGGSSNPPGPSTGTLVLTVSGLPNLVPAAITIQGPAGFSQSPTASATYTAAPGAYTLTALPSGGLNPTPASQVVTVTAGQTTPALVTYSAPPVAVSINPGSPSVAVNGQLTFSASVTGHSEVNVTWEVLAGTATGSVAPATASTTTVFTAGGTPGTCQVRARSVADTSKTATATVTITGPSGFAVTPASLRIAPGTGQQFTAWLNGAATTAVTWSLQNFSTPSATASIDAGGLLAAGSTVTTFEVKAVNQASPSQSATALVTVATEVTVQIVGPAASTISTLDAVAFSAAVSPQGVNPYVTWSVQEGAAAGRIIEVAWFNAFLPPATAATYHPVATSIADPTRQATIAVTVQAPPSPARFTAAAGAPAGTRAYHSAATLGDGRILFIGGNPDQGGAVLASAELFQPATATFSVTGVPFQARPQGAACPMDATRILVCGGITGWNDASDGGEVYDSASGTFTVTANAMAAKRTGHAVLRLASGPHAGKLLILGGNNGPIPYGIPAAQTTASADLFDPATLLFSPLGQSMKEARTAFTATELANGKILIAGGFSYAASGSLATAELFDPATGTFAYTTAPMTQSRAWHSATLLSTGPQAGKVLLVGGNSNSDALASAELFDPASGTFSAAGATLLRPRQRHTASRLADGRIMIAGGEAPNRYWGSAEVYDPATGQFAFLAGLATPRSGHSATPIGSGPLAGKVLLFGGQLNSTLPAGAELAP